MSSRNRYLTADERLEAVWLSKTLTQVAERVRRGVSQMSLNVNDIADLESAATQILNQRGWVTDYISIKRRADLKPPMQDDLQAPERLVVLGASKLGATRLIDNLEI
jgi:pantoate--beta-alanine ligase